MRQVRALSGGALRAVRGTVATRPMLTRGRRSPDTTPLRFDGGVLVRRLGLGGVIVGAGVGVGMLAGGFAWALGALIALPGVTTLASARRPYLARCPACESSLGGATLHLADEPVLGIGTHDHRCDACGVYVDATVAGVREVPFNRRLDVPGYGVSFPHEAWEAVRWASRCVACGEPATRALTLGRAKRGILSGDDAVMVDAVREGAVPYCAAHGERNEASARAVEVARSGDAVEVRLALYGVYRAFLDDNREHAELTVRAMAEPEG